MLSRNEHSAPVFRLQSKIVIAVVFCLLRVVGFSRAESYRGGIKFAALNALFRPRSGQKLARVSAQYRTKMQTSAAFAFWRGRAADWTSFRIYAEARDMELARTKRLFLPAFSGKTEKVGLRSYGSSEFAKVFSPTRNVETGPLHAPRAVSAPFRRKIAALSRGDFLIQHLNQIAVCTFV